MSTETLLTLLLIVVALLLFVAIAALAVIAYLYLSLRQRIPYLLQETQATWREKELEAIRREQVEIANKTAMAQLQNWREQELELARKQQLELAHGEARVQLEQWKTEYTQEIRQDAIQKSQSVTLGKVTEHFVPYLPNFTYNPKDARFLGSPIDFVVFDGLDDGEVKGIVFVEIKTGSSALSSRERRIRDAVQSGKVQWIELRPQLGASLAIADQVANQDAPTVESLDDADRSAPSGKSETTPPDRLRFILKHE